jgi:cysteinyl-tRNA synthetase
VLGLQHELRSTDASPSGSTIPSETEIEALIEQRRSAKAARDFSRADQIRDQLRSQGIELIDRPGGNCEWLRSDTSGG